MTEPNTLFREANATEILELAARYYDTENQAYTETELIDAGLAVQIPDRLIRKAIQDLRLQKQRQLEQQRKIKHRLQVISGFGCIVASAIACWSVFTYNHLVAVTAQVETAHQQLVNQQQRRADLIPQLVDLTNTYAHHQQEIVRQLVTARQGYLQADDVADQSKAIAILERAILNFYRYANTNQQLSSSQALINLQYEVTGTANRLAVERMRYSQAVQNYNQQIQQVPQSLIAKAFGFESF